MKGIAIRMFLDGECTHVICTTLGLAEFEFWAIVKEWHNQNIWL